MRRSQGVGSSAGLTDFIGETSVSAQQRLCQIPKGCPPVTNWDPRPFSLHEPRVHSNPTGGPDRRGEPQVRRGRVLATCVGLLLAGIFVLVARTEVARVERSD